MGGLIIILVCGGFGHLLKQALRRRVVDLQAFLQALKIMETEIRYGLNPLPMVFKQVSCQVEGEVGRFFGELAAAFHLCEGQTAGELWRQKLEVYRDKMAINFGDFEVLLNLGLGLGVSDMVDQGRRLELSRQQLLQRLQEAELQAEKMGKVWTTCGWAGGIVLVLLWL